MLVAPGAVTKDFEEIQPKNNQDVSFPWALEANASFPSDRIHSYIICVKGGCLMELPLLPTIQNDGSNIKTLKDFI